MLRLRGFKMLRLLLTINLMLFSISLMAETTNPLVQPQFKSFSAKVTGSKVRLRALADLDSHIITQLSKNDLVLVNDFIIFRFYLKKIVLNKEVYIFL